MEIFQGKSILKFTAHFKSDADCRHYLADIKWSNGFKCLKCKHSKASIRSNQSRCCTRCKHIESPGSGTLFHKVKFGLRKAFMIVFEMSSTTKSISASQLARRFEISRKTAWLFTHKVRTAMESGANYSMQGNVHVDEFVVGGKETRE